MISYLQRTKRAVMTALIALAALFALAFAATSQATDTEAFLVEQQKLDQAALADWVQSKSKRKISEAQAVRIVEETYRQASEHRIDPLLILAVMRNESEYDAQAVSREGATGLMQVIPKWHRAKIKGRSIRDVAVNIEVGAQILQDCLAKHGDRMHQTLNCYSGGGSSKYKNKVAKQHSAIRTFLVEYKFTRDLPIVASNTFNEPRSRGRPDTMLDTLVAAVTSNTPQ